MRVAVIRNARITGKDGQRRPCPQKSRAYVEIHMPQDVYIYDSNVPVPKDVRYVEIPKGVTVIGEDAFRDCSDLQSVTIPDSVTEIDDYAFSRCSGLQSVTIPGSVTKIGSGAFSYCAGLRSVTIPDSVTEISLNAFYGCSGLQSVTIPDSITEVSDGAFQNCSGLQSVIIPDSVTEIGVCAFRNCLALQSVTMPDSVTKIGSEAFSGCSALQSVTISDSVTEIGFGAFDGCPGLQSVTIPDGVTKIGGYAFRGCSGLQSVTIPDGVTEIGNHAFSDCSGLQSVTIPDGVTEIGDSAFKDCSNLQSVVIPEGITEIRYGAFYGCSSLRSVTIPDSVTEIGANAFEKCSALQSVTIPDSVTKIGESTFKRCSALQSVTMPDDVTKIDDSAFNGCSNLESVTIPDGVTEIGNYAFQNCSALQSVTIPDSITKISRSAFSRCSALQSVTIPDSVTEIEAHAFCRCNNLQSITIPDSVTKIGFGVFEGCSGLQSVAIPDNVTKIGKDAFADCPALQSLIYKGVNIAPFINIDGYGVNTFDVIKVLVEHRNPLNENTVRRGIDMAHRGRLDQWAADYPVFGEMRLPPATKSVDGKTEECLRRLFGTQKKTGCHVPKILDKLAIAVCACGIPPERLAETFDVRYTEAMIRDGVPAVPATACRCYYDRGICDMLIQKDGISIMAEAIGLYNRSRHRECYKHLMDFILSHPDTKIEDLQYAADHAEKIPMRAGITLTQVRQHRIYTESLAEVEKIEAKYGETVPGFKLSDYPCSIAPAGVTYNGMTARVLDLSDNKDIALAARLGDLTNCCQCLGSAGETAMMHGFLNPDAGFWVIEDKDGAVKAQAEIWKTDNGDLVFDNIEFANTDREHLSDRADRLRGVIVAWAMESGYANIIMGCGYNELGTGSMEHAPIPELRLTPEEVFALQEGNDAYVSFGNMDDVHRYMQTEKYRPGDFVYTDADEQCVYIKKEGTVADYLMKGYDCALTEKCPSSGHETEKERDNNTACK